MKLLKIPYVDLSSSSSVVLSKPAIRVKISYLNQESNFEFYSIIDSGADHCVFPADYGRKVGITIEKGEARQFLTTGGLGTIYFHAVRVFFKIERKVYLFDCQAGFMEELNGQGVGLLGREGFFNLFRKVSFNNHERLVELEANTESASKGK